MQEPNGDMTIIKTPDKMAMAVSTGKYVRVDDVFRIRNCYFVVESLKRTGFVAKGLSREEYFSRRRAKRR